MNDFTKTTAGQLILGLIGALGIVGLFYLFYHTSWPMAVRGSLLSLQLLIAWGIIRLKVYKPVATFLLIYVIVGGFLIEVPARNILNETIRNLYFHVPMWFAMILLLLTSMIYSIKYLRKNDLSDDFMAAEFAKVGTLFGMLGIFTGMLWAQYTWGHFWPNDPKQSAAALGIIAYFAYLVLRLAFGHDDREKAKVTAVYNIFAFPLLVMLLFVYPRLVPNSLHPGVGGNPGFNQYDLNDNMKIVFYPAVIGWTLFGVWMASEKVKLKKLFYRLHGVKL